ncbi:diaminopropionate ammonia-lyase [Clostridium aestuarii]|uniref:Diaminopropionate ammonia-lyase n=1 Tax=Clostridium aestuarii TaxID=338193 RepID=A0ABT4CVN5_9CLOT|nr:diaminopropionate ammonia-lyase [Clostridium aestuarii]MCY6483043.1 diaminopropionate ammonia-lyase [Clostridium aestuarii]
MERVNETYGIKAVVSDIATEGFPKIFNEEVVEGVRNFHASIKGYQATPLVRLDELSKELGVSRIYVKDESYRFGLNAFKSLGGTFAIAKFLCEKLGVDIHDVDFEYFKSQEIKEKIKDIVFVTATDGNHGRGIAWAATQLGCKSVVYLPKGSAQRRVDAIIEAGAEAYVTELNYDDAVRLATQKGEENGWYLIQDTGFEGYEKIPNWISQGYITMADEALDQLKLDGIQIPTHVFLQAGVGAMAGGVLGYYVNKFKGNHPTTVIVEPEQAACIYKSALAGDGKPHNVTGDLNTIMAGLACGEPNTVTWEILRDFAKAYVSCPDYVSANGVRILGNSIGQDKKIISGESGSVGVGLLSLLMVKPELEELKNDLGLNENSVVLFFNTEGDTDPENYKKIVHEGKNPSIF